MPRCDLALCHGGHGTMVRALAEGCRVVIAPVSGDMNENAARADWAGVGVRLPWRFVSPATVRLAVERALADERMGERVREVAEWSAGHDGAERAAEIVEQFAGATVARTP
jgi:UDP:flavonoid glycosyltransferase YjiC (YdhE family)